MLLVQTDLMTVHVLNISSGYEFNTICGAWVLAGCAWLLACRHHLLSGTEILAASLTRSMGVLNLVVVELGSIEVCCQTLNGSGAET